MIRIERCYDSHVHLMGVGQMLSMLQLRDLDSADNLRTLRIEKDFFRGDWLIGFGWDQHLFPGQKYPTRRQLDAIFPDFPVAFTRADGHAMWVNTEALRRCGRLKPVKEWNLPPGAEAFADEQGLPTGILLDRAMEPFHAAIPQDTLEQKRKALQKGIEEFNRAGFTHLRDMSGDRDQWNLLRELEKSGELTLYIDQNFLFERPEDFEPMLRLCQEARAEGSSRIRVRGVKFYLDGALGSEGAALTCNYCGSESNGFLIWKREQVRDWMRRTWEAGFEVAIHAIGDRASLLLAEVARELWDSGLSGRLNIEHGQVMAPEAITLLQDADVVVHIQPCHWLSDRKWLQEKLGPLAKRAFPWAALQEARIPFQWGSDAPIERASLFDNRQALHDSAKAGIAPLTGDWWKAHQHPDSGWGANCHTEMDETSLLGVTFDGRPLQRRS